jgi:ketosteroid isomerase-like protein
MSPPASSNRERIVSDATRSLVQDLYDAYRRGDNASVADLIDDDVDWVIHGPVQVFPFSGARRGKQGALDALAAIAKDYAIERYDPEIVVVDNDRAAVMLNAAFMQRATRRTLTFRIADFMKFRDGKLIEFREFCDTFDVVEQALGRWLVV